MPYSLCIFDFKEKYALRAFSDKFSAELFSLPLLLNITQDLCLNIILDYSTLNLIVTANLIC
jgi:hypothetical protein